MAYTPLSNVSQETGGNLAALVAKDFATSAKQDTGNASLASIASAEATGNTTLAALLAYQITRQSDLLAAVLVELRINNALLQSGLNVRDDLDALRADPSFSSLP